MKIRNRSLEGIKFEKCGPVSVAQLVATMDNLCRGRGSNPGFSTSPRIMYVNLATKILDKKK